MLYWSGLPVATVLLVISPALAGYLTLVYWPAAVAFAVLFTVGIYWHTREAYMGALAALFTGGTAAVASFALAYVLKPYQLARVLSFTNPEAEAYRKTYGFHLVQSKAAIGSGGLFGKGFMQAPRRRRLRTGAVHGLHLQCHRRRVRLRGRRPCAAALCAPAGATHPNGNGVPPSFRTHGGGWRGRCDSGARVHQHRHGHGTPSRDRHSATLPLLRRFVAAGQHADAGGGAQSAHARDDFSIFV